MKLVFCFSKVYLRERGEVLNIRASMSGGGVESFQADSLSSVEPQDP